MVDDKAKPVGSILFVVFVLFFSGIVSGDSSTDGDGNTDDRTAHYSGPPRINSSTDIFTSLVFICMILETGTDDKCPIDHPYRASCDSSSWSNTGLVQGIGAVKFCDIIQESTIAINVTDLVINRPLSEIGCLHDLLDEIEVYKNVGAADPMTSLDLPPGCIQHPDDLQNTTRVGVFLHGPPDALGGTYGKVTLSYGTA